MEFDEATSTLNISTNQDGGNVTGMYYDEEAETFVISVKPQEGGTINGGEENPNSSI